MHTTRVKDIGSQLLVIQDNKSGDFYEKDRCKWSAVDGNIVLSYYELLSGDIYGYTKKLSEPAERFSEPRETSITDCY